MHKVGLKVDSEGQSFYVPKCSLCREEITLPVQLECGHLFDLHCISEFFHRMPICPVDRKPIAIKKVVYRPDVIVKVGAIFQLKCTPDFQVDPFLINLNASSQHLKIIASRAYVTGKSDIVQAAFTPWPGDLTSVVKQWECTYDDKTGAMPQPIYGKLSAYPFVPEKVYHLSTVWQRV